MIKHKRIYLDYFNYGEQDYVPCEICYKKAVDIHHIRFKSQNGGNNIENLMALCRKCHENAHLGKVHQDVFQARHDMFLKKHKNES